MSDSNSISVAVSVICDVIDQCVLIMSFSHTNFDTNGNEGFHD